MQVRPRLSIVIPAFNEAARIRGGLEAVVRHFARSGEDVEVVVVDDGCTDATVEAVARFAGEGPPQGRVTMGVLRNGGSRGKGYSVKHGVLMARGDLVLISDADFSTPIDDLPLLLQAVEKEGYGIAIGSRALEDSRVEIRQAAWREMMGRGFNRPGRVVTGLAFRGNQGRV